ncbi:alanine--glyoxylate aminotransferase 2 homolog 3, mitochondrial-like [Olea europaea subsp. europaea]|uniref:Alanine--glyoxylate aminotransferase 2 homolog 3, mitochondrial-like n=1 Tax=Olea europaea subsp. europaea TaxID=158383 RepID=A0A8S0PZY5_OLEEU|nr:alanine--glyoxylate aminotransferase 2 homolog 3, mitochondrial-like [Olea europaea subsp. europaea]
MLCVAHNISSSAMVFKASEMEFPLALWLPSRDCKVLTHRSYFNTFGGNPVCDSVGHAVLKVIEKENLQQNAFVVGLLLKQCLNSLKEKYEIIGDVRRRGLMLGVELVTDRQLKIPAKAETLHVMDQMKETGVLIGKGAFSGMYLGSLLSYTSPRTMLVSFQCLQILPIMYLVLIIDDITLLTFL